MADDGGGWVKLYRSILKWEWWEDLNCFRLFMYCLVVANASDRKWKGKVIRRGMFVTSYARLSNGTNLTVHQVRDALERLKKTNELTCKSANRFTIITVCNYEKYQEPQQGGGQTNGKQTASKRQTDGKQTADGGQTNGNKQEYNNGRMKEGDIASSFPDGKDEVPGSEPGAESDVEDIGNYKIDYSKLAQYWNERTQGRFGRILCIENDRRKMVKARIRKYGKVAFMEAIDKVCASDYLESQTWFNFDWLVRPNNFDKVMAGNFDNKEKQTQDGNASTNNSKLGLGTVTRPTNKGMQTDI